MVRLAASYVALAAALFAGHAVTHPGHDVRAEAVQRAAYRSGPEYRSLSHCAEALKAREAEMIERRKAITSQLRRRQLIEKRDFATVLATSHKSNESVTVDSSDEAIFGTTSSCILQAEATEGPFYVTGEYVRQNITESQKGVPLTFDVQLIDVTTCKPISDVALETWHANSTGVYGGVGPGNGNGNGDDLTNINNTWLRGIQFTDSDGVATYDTVFPGHYAGRCPHIHILAHINATLNAENNTIEGGQISHVGQLFFDQDLINAVETNAPYTTNTLSLTMNKDDFIFAGEAADSDPVLNYVLLGDSVSSGLFGWATVGIDPTASKNVSVAANHDSSGGHALNNTGFPGGFPSGFSGFPSGFTGFPSGFTGFPSGAFPPPPTPTATPT